MNVLLRSVGSRAFLTARTRVLQVMTVCGFLVATTTAPMAAEKVFRPSPYFEVVSISRGLLKNAHNDYYYMDAARKRVYIGSSHLAEYDQTHFGLSRPAFIVSEDGKRLLYEHAPAAAGKRTSKRGALFLYEYGVGETLIIESSELRSRSVAWPKPLPPFVMPVFPTRRDEGPFRRESQWLVSTEGETHVLGLFGASELETAAYSGNAARVGELLESGASTVAANHWEASALEIAMLQGFEDVALVLLAPTTNRPELALHLASAYRLPQALDALIALGVAPDATNAQGETALHAVINKQVENQYRLIWGDAHNDAGLRRFTAADEAIVRRLLLAGADIEARDRTERTPIFAAVQRMSRSRAEISTSILANLLGFGADINAVDADGNTPLHIACYTVRNERFADVWEQSPSAALVRFLLDNGADVDAANVDGHTPLQFAVQANNLRTAELLVSKGADDSKAFRHIGMGRKVEGQTIRQRIDATRREILD